MKIVAVDLAARFSAAVVLDDTGQVLDQCDSWGRTETEWVEIVTASWRADLGVDHLVIEDLPHGVPFMTNTKAVCRLQGRIAESMHLLGALPAVRFIVPAAWRRHHGLRNGDSPAVVVDTATALGYTPPDLSGRAAKAGERAIARKVVTDYCAAYLIGTWFLAMHQQHANVTFPGTSGYGDASPYRPRRKAAKSKARNA